MPLFFNKSGDKVIGTFDNISKILLEKFDKGESVSRNDIIVLRIGDNNAFEHYYLDKETAIKYNVSDGMILTNEKFLLEDIFEDFLEDIDIINSEKLKNIFSRYL